MINQKRRFGKVCQLDLILNEFLPFDLQVCVAGYLSKIVFYQHRIFLFLSNVSLIAVQNYFRKHVLQISGYRFPRNFLFTDDNRVFQWFHGFDDCPYTIFNKNENIVIFQTIKQKILIKPKLLKQESIEYNWFANSVFIGYEEIKKTNEGHDFYIFLEGFQRKLMVASMNWTFTEFHSRVCCAVGLPWYAFYFSQSSYKQDANQTLLQNGFRNEMTLWVCLRLGSI